MNLDEVQVRPVERREEPLHRELMTEHHYLGYLPKIGQSLWYVATYQEQWVALLNFSAAAWKCAVRDRWIGWNFHRQYDYDRLKLIANNSRFLILPHWHYRNLGSKLLSLCQKRLANDLATTLWLSAAAVRDLGRPQSFPRHPLSCRQLVVSGADPRLSTDSPGLQQHRGLAQKSVCHVFTPSYPLPACWCCTATTLSSRSP